MESIRIGHVSERNSRQHNFPVGNLLAKYPNCHPFVMFQRPGENTAYPVAQADLNGSILTWTFDHTDTAKSGDGLCWLVMMSDDGEQVWMTDKMPTITGDGYTQSDAPDEPVIGWIERLLAKAAEMLAIRDEVLQAEQRVQAAEVRAWDAAVKAADSAIGAAEQAYIAAENAGKAAGSADAAHVDAVAAYQAQGLAEAYAANAKAAADRAEVDLQPVKA